MCLKTLAYFKPSGITTFFTFRHLLTLLYGNYSFFGIIAALHTHIYAFFGNIVCVTLQEKYGCEFAFTAKKNSGSEILRLLGIAEAV